MTLQDLSFVERGDGETPSAHSLQLVFADHGIRVDFISQVFPNRPSSLCPAKSKT